MTNRLYAKIGTTLAGILLAIGSYYVLSHNGITSVRIIIATVLLDILLLILVFTGCDKFESRKFNKEYQAIIREYNTSKNAKRFHQKLTQMENAPKSQSARDALQLSISSSLFFQKRYEEALDAAMAIRPRGQKMRRLVDQQIYGIRQKMDAAAKKSGALPQEAEQTEK